MWQFGEKAYPRKALLKKEVVCRTGTRQGQFKTTGKGVMRELDNQLASEE